VHEKNMTVDKMTVDGMIKDQMNVNQILK
jgi:hypothetical protein